MTLATPTATPTALRPIRNPDRPCQPPSGSPLGYFFSAWTEPSFYCNRNSALDWLHFQLLSCFQQFSTTPSPLDATPTPFLARAVATNVAGVNVQRVEVGIGFGFGYGVYAAVSVAYYCCHDLHIFHKFDQIANFSWKFVQVCAAYQGFLLHLLVPICQIGFSTALAFTIATVCPICGISCDSKLVNSMESKVNMRDSWN